MADVRVTVRNTVEGSQEVVKASKNIDETGQAAERANSRLTTLGATQNQLALAVFKSQDAAQKLATAQKSLADNSDPAKQQALEGAVLKAQVAFDREQATVGKLSTEMDKLNSGNAAVSQSSDAVTAVQNRLALAMQTSQNAANNLATAQKALASNTDPSKQQMLETAVAKAQVALDRSTASANKLQGELKQLSNEGGKSSEMMAKLGTVAAGVAVAGVYALGKGLAFSVGQAAEAQMAQADLNATIQSTGGAAGLTADEVNKMAGSLAQITTFGDDAILTGQNMLLTFTNIGENVFPRASEVMLDMATKFGSIDAASVQLGKALNDPTEGMSALTRVGVTFTEQQENQIKALQESGDVMGAQNVILDELTREFGGQARAAAETYTGTIEQLKNQVGELGEAVGTGLLPQLARSAEATTGVVSRLTDWVVMTNTLTDSVRMGIITQAESQQIMNKVTATSLTAVEVTEQYSKRIEDASIATTNWQQSTGNISEQMAFLTEATTAQTTATQEQIAAMEKANAEYDFNVAVSRDAIEASMAYEVSAEQVAAAEEKREAATEAAAAAVASSKAANDAARESLDNYQIALSEAFLGAEQPIEALMAAQDAMAANGIGAADELAIANTNLSDTYKQVAVDALFANTTNLEATTALAVELGLLTQEQADLRTNSAETTMAIEALASSQKFASMTAEEQAEAIGKIITKAERFANSSPYVAEVQTEAEAAKESLREIMSGIDKVDGRVSRAQVTVDTSAAQSALDALRDALDGLNNAQAAASAANPDNTYNQGGRAFGGDVSAGQMYQVGEFNRPEFFSNSSGLYMIPGDQGKVFSNSQSEAMMGGSSVIVNIYPSPGMNESQLASMVINKLNQQLAAQRRMASAAGTGYMGTM